MEMFELQIVILCTIQHFIRGDEPFIPGPFGTSFLRCTFLLILVSAPLRLIPSEAQPQTDGVTELPFHALPPATSL